jgi:ATP-dependent Lhr-like helicase
LLERHGVLTREAVHAEGIPGGFSAVYPVLKAMEESGKARRGYFVAGLGATQFALPGAEDRLRALRSAPGDAPRTLRLSAVDPASPYGAALPWPQRAEAKAERRAGAHVFLQDGELVASSGRSEVHLLTFLPPREPERARAAAALARALAAPVDGGERRAVLVSTVDGRPPAESALGPHLETAGFVPGSHGYLKRQG